MWNFLFAQLLWPESCTSEHFDAETETEKSNCLPQNVCSFDQYLLTEVLKVTLREACLSQAYIEGAEKTDVSKAKS